MALYQRLALSSVLACVGVFLGAASLYAGPFSVRVFNPNATIINNDPITLHVYDSATPPKLLGTYRATTGTFSTFSITVALPADKSLRFEFSRQSTGKVMLTIDGLLSTAVNLQTIDAVVPLFSQ